VTNTNSTRSCHIASLRLIRLGNHYWHILRLHVGINGVRLD
jgi:hypothetical protein